MRWWVGLVLVVACSDSVHGTTHVSPPYTPIDGTGASSSSGGSGGSSGGATIPGPDAGQADAAPVVPHSCSGKTGAPGDSTLNLTSGGMARDSLLHVPPSYEAGHGMPLVINYHGFSSNAPEQVALTNMNPVADAKHFIVAYPDGLGMGWNAGACCSELQPAGVDDVQFTKDLLALLEKDYCIDPRRIYATGFSNGGFMSHLLGCKMSDVFAAIAPVSGVMGIPDDSCNPLRPVPVLHIHGTADPVVPYDGGPALKLLPPIVFQSVQQTMEFWRGADSCLGPPVVVFDKGDATCVQWGDCQGSVEVQLCTLSGDGHQWPDSSLVVPGLGNTSTSLDATSYISDWLLGHAL
jgi:polyhydroxybutyrate depolymerase